MRTEPHKLPDRCPKCDGIAFKDTDIHDGDSVRRDCVQCNRTLGFVFWNDDLATSEHQRQDTMRALQSCQPRRMAEARSERVERLLGSVPRIKTAARLFTEKAAQEATEAAQGTPPVETYN